MGNERRNSRLRQREHWSASRSGIGRFWHGGSRQHLQVVPARGVLEDDDEVAIAHGPPETGCQPVSEAMVNIRQTLLKAQHSKIISSRVREALEDIGKKLFYPNRTYQVLFRYAGDSGIDQDWLHWLQRWLPKHRVNQKQDDAVAMLRTMQRRLTHG